MLRAVFARMTVFSGKSVQKMANKSSALVSAKHYSTKPPEMSKSTNESVKEESKCIESKEMDKEINLFGPQDIRAPLPGNIGVSADVVSVTQIVKSDCKTVDAIELESITSDSNYVRQHRVMDQFLTGLNEPIKCSAGPQKELESIAHECPQLMLKDFHDLFPVVSRVRPELTKGLTVVTLCQKSDNDMSCWSEEVDDEREELMKQFVDVAKDICDYLKTAGFWADFIDPSSGRPYLSEYTNATFFETDERYRHFGFTIEDLGCCKVISHHVWGTHAFVGAIFTNASIDSIEMNKVLTNSYKSN